MRPFIAIFRLHVGWQNNVSKIPPNGHKNHCNLAIEAITKHSGVFEE